MSSDFLAARIHDSIMKPNLEASTSPFSDGRGWARDSEVGTEGGEQVSTLWCVCTCTCA